jgi:hypothetical protein
LRTVPLIADNSTAEYFAMVLWHAHTQSILRVATEWFQRGYLEQIDEGSKTLQIVLSTVHKVAAVVSE